MARITQKEAVARLLASKPDRWFASFDLVQKTVDGKFTGIAPMERAYELVKEGFDSEKYHYEFEHDKRGKYAYFKVKSRTEKSKVQLSHVTLPTKAPSLNELSPADKAYWASLQNA